MNVLVSQRVDVISERRERRDSLDQAWPATLEKLLNRTICISPVPNSPRNVPDLIQGLLPSLIVLSGGNNIGEFPERDATEKLLLDHAADSSIPVLAVCRGMQMVQSYLRGVLSPVKRHIGCEHQIFGAEGLNLPTLKVNSFHGFGISEPELAENLQGLYLHRDGTVEAARHTELPWLAVMWHPERSGSGMSLANEWLAQWLEKALCKPKDL